MKRLVLNNCLLLIAAFLTLIQSCNTQITEKPNIIFILADDLGYMDIQEYAYHMTGEDKHAMYYETPHLDLLVQEGCSFERAYANQLCSPTRASLLTGKYAARLGFTTATPFTKTYYNQNLPVPEGSYAHDVLDHHDRINIQQAWLNGSTNTALPAGTTLDVGRDETTIAEALPDYYSAFIGKWHVGGHGADGYGPEDQGFHPLAWFDAGGSQYFDWVRSWDGDYKKRAPEVPMDSLALGTSGNTNYNTYLTDDLTSMALDFLDERSQLEDEPFFLYFCHFAVHSPLQAKEEDIAYFEEKGTRGWNKHENAVYAGMIRSLDYSVGAILDKLEELGMEDNTLIVFMSDNGGIDSELIPKGTVTSNAPLRGGKACLTEGGIRVPLVFYWKGKITGGRWSDEVVDCNDIFPTIVEIAGYDPEPYYYGKEGIDGRSLAGIIQEREETSYTRDVRYWHYPFNVIYKNPYDSLPLTPHSAVMKGDYKLIFDWYGRLHLYNVVEDVTESYNLVHEMPEKVDLMFSMLMHWLEENVEETYLPLKNLNYRPELEQREEEFVDLFEAWKTEDGIENE